MSKRQYQEQFKTDVYNAWRQGARNVIGVMPTGCHAAGHLILMWDGHTKPVEDIVVGDTLMGDDSTPRVVKRLFRGREMMHKITPVKGESFIVNDNHVLSLVSTNDNKTYRGGEVLNIKVKDHLNRSKYFKHIHKLRRVGVDFHGGDTLTIPPYVLGALLGDGGFTTCTPQLTGGDKVVMDEVYDFAVSMGCNPTWKHDENCSRLSLGNNGVHHRGNRNRFTVELEKWGVQGSGARDKKVPHEYKIADRHSRVEILAGLIDTDGYQSNNGWDFISKSEQLSTDVVFIARSLGLAAYMKRCTKSCQNNFSGVYYRVSIYGDCNKIPTRVRRKTAGKRNQIKNVLRTGFKIEPVGEGEFFGFEVDCNHLYLDGSFTVHHNSGKSYTVGEIVREHDSPTAVIAHRQELVGQLSMALASNGVQHQIIGPDKIRKFIIGQHLRELGTNMINPNARTAVIGVDTLVRRQKQYDRWLKSVTLWVQDECHHLLRDNKWGTAAQMMPNARGLGVTATPIRADGRGLGRHTDGLMDVMVEGPQMRELIDAGYLTDYRIFAPPSDVDYSHVNVGKSGDYVQKQLKTAVRESHLIGDVVQHYLRIAPGKLGITFATDVETATDISRQFNAAGVRSEVVSAKTPDATRAEIIRRFRAREIMQLVNVDLFGEGFDLPAIEVVSMARRTQSYSLYSQQFGRALRPMEGKDHAIIIDHAGNVMLHGLPDKDRVWSLDAREKRPSCKNPDDDIPLRYCVECTQPYERIRKVCPWCGHYPVPEERSGPEYVDGDLHELSPDALAAMRAARDEVDENPMAVVNRMKFAGAPEVVWRSAFNNCTARQEMQGALRESIAWFADIQERKGHDQSESYRSFYHLFGIDVLSAQALGRPEALALAERVNNYLGVAKV